MPFAQGQRPIRAVQLRGLPRAWRWRHRPAADGQQLDLWQRARKFFSTIMQGRPNGMPSFRNRIPEYQAWEIAAYVRSMAGLLPKGVSPNRPDHMRVKPAESSTPRKL